MVEWWETFHKRMMLVVIGILATLLVEVTMD